MLFNWQCHFLLKLKIIWCSTEYYSPMKELWIKKKQKKGYGPKKTLFKRLNMMAIASLGKHLHHISVGCFHEPAILLTWDLLLIESKGLTPLKIHFTNVLSWNIGWIPSNWNQWNYGFHSFGPFLIFTQCFVGWGVTNPSQNESWQSHMKTAFMCLSE